MCVLWVVEIKYVCKAKSPSVRWRLFWRSLSTHEHLSIIILLVDILPHQYIAVLHEYHCYPVLLVPNWTTAFLLVVFALSAVYLNSDLQLALRKSFRGKIRKTTKNEKTREKKEWEEKGCFANYSGTQFAVSEIAEQI